MAEEKLNQEQQGNMDMPAENVAEKANEIMDTAIAGVRNDALGDSRNGGGNKPMLRADGGNIGEKFKGLPMRELISAPLIAAAEAQQQLAATAWDFYEKIAFYDKQVGSHNVGDTRIVEFTVNRPVQQNGEIVMAEQKVQAPFIGLVPIPSLLIDRIDVDFQMEVTAACRDLQEQLLFGRFNQHFERMVRESGDKRKGIDLAREHPFHQPDRKVSGSCIGQPTAADRGAFQTHGHHGKLHRTHTYR